MLFRNCFIIAMIICIAHGVSKRALQKSHEKPQAEKWMESFFGRNMAYDQTPSLVNLINEISRTELSGCTSIILYDTIVEKSEGLILEQLFRSYPIPYIHGQITSDSKMKIDHFRKRNYKTCVSYILFMADVMKSKDVIGEQSEEKVIILARSSQWRVYEFLSSMNSRYFVNLLVIAQSEKIADVGAELPFILYTHKLYVDGIGSSSPTVLTSWRNTKFTRNMVLFPEKIKEGFSGHRFIVSAAHQPPFVVKSDDPITTETVWDGVEIRLLQMLSERFNYTTDYRESKEAARLGSGDAITNDVAAGKVNLGVGGVYVTSDRFSVVDVSQSHSYDCAAFITLASTALPRYRAIMGPFHWSVWMALTLVYLFAIFPLSLSDKHTLRPLLRNPEEIENMFWYVFGTFTNCFTFKGPSSWSKSNKITTRLLVAFYWMFTIITTACYTGSIIAFVTLPIFPATIDTTKQLVRGRFQIGTLDKGGWQHWFKGSLDYETNLLFKSAEYLPTVHSGLKNVTKAFFWPYAFLGSRDELDFIVRTNFTTQNKRNLLHISSNCFVPYGVSLLFPKNSPYKRTIDKGLMLAVESGFLIKMKNDLEWDTMRSPTGKLLQANRAGYTKLKIADRALSMDDTQGMFLLLGIGFLFGLFALISEWLGGCFNFCSAKIKRRFSTVSIDSNPRSYQSPTPREKANSLEYSVHTRLCSQTDETILKDLMTNGIVSFESSDKGKINYDEEIERAFDLNGIFGACNDDQELKKELGAEKSVN